jgi:hypothetical protein
MNPHHTGFLFTNITELKGRNYKSELLDKQMEIDTARYIEYAPKDFFYMTLHDPTPPSLEAQADKAEKTEKTDKAERAGKTAWEPDPGVQPAPSWMAGLWRAPLGDVEVLAIEPGRASFRVRAGTAEPDAKSGSASAHELADDDAHRVLFALTLGTSLAKRPRGLATDGRIALPMSGGEHLASLVASEDGALSIVTAKEQGVGLPAHVDAVELPLLLEAGKAVVGLGDGRARAALGLAPGGRVYVARSGAGAAGADALAEALRRAGCARAVLLDRGAGASGALFRAGTPTPPRSRYEETTLYGMGKAMLPRGFRFESQHPVEPPAPKKK